MVQGHRTVLPVRELPLTFQRNRPVRKYAGWCERDVRSGYIPCPHSLLDFVAVYNSGTMPGKERVAVLIDGSNFYHYLKAREVSFPFGTGARFKYRQMIDWIVGDRLCVAKNYYVGILRNVDQTDKSASMVRGQQKFLAGLRNDGFKVVPGKIMYDAGRIREKGTDVAIALDLALGAVRDTFDTVVLVSSDTDLVPALRIVRQEGKKAEYVGFAHRPSFGIQKNVDFSRLLSPSDVERFTERGLF